MNEQTSWLSPDGLVELHLGDCREVTPSLQRRFSAIVTDPPYGLSFMGEHWDHGVPGCDYWEPLRSCAVPGANLLAFGGSRTFHRLFCAIEDAGWEIRDTIMWLHGQGWPKGADLARAIERLPCGPEHAIQWGRHNSALKPAHEPICLAMSPLDGTFAQNALLHGVAGLDVRETCVATGGRYPANVIHDGSEEVTSLFPETASGSMRAGQRRKKSLGRGGYGDGLPDEATSHDTPGDRGSAARFFYCAKAPPAERIGLTHKTVKPLALMDYLVRLIKMPQRNLVLDPFAGSGTTLLACWRNSIPSVGIELDRRHFDEAVARLSREISQES